MNISKIPVKSWGQQVEEEELDRSYYEQLDDKEKIAGLQSALEIVTRQNSDLKAQLEDGRRVVGDYMGNEQTRTDQLNHLAAQVVRLQRENEDWKDRHCSLMELNKQCAQSNVDIHEQKEALKYKLKKAEEENATKLTAWINANASLTRQNESLKEHKQMVEHLRARNVDLEKTMRELNCNLVGSEFACGVCVACRLNNAEKIIDKVNWHIIKLQTSDAAFRKIIDFQNNLAEACKNTLTSLSNAPWFRPLTKKDKTMIADTLHTVSVFNGQIDHEFENLRSGKVVKIQ